MLKSLMWTLAFVMASAVSISLPAQAKGVEEPTQVTDRIWVMGVPDKQDIEYFKEQGGEVVVSLLSIKEMAGSAETQWTTSNKLAFYHVPVDGAMGVTFDNARALDKLLLMNVDKTVLVHCASANRVGALFALRAAWLDGQSKEKALEIGRQHGMRSLESKVSKMLAE